MEYKRINFQGIATHQQAEIRMDSALKEVDACGEGALITDALVNKQFAGDLVLRILSNQPRTYKIKVLKTQWGEPVKKGDRVEWKAGMQKRDHLGRKYTIDVINAKRRAGLEREIEIWHEAIVDECGCIEVPFEDAALLLNTRGVHFQSGEPLTGMREYSSEPIAARQRDGSIKTRIQHYWLYQECPPWEYEQLKKERKPRKANKPASPMTEVENDKSKN